MNLSTVQQARHALELHGIEKRFRKGRNEYAYALKGVSLTG